MTSRKPENGEKTGRRPVQVTAADAVSGVFLRHNISAAFGLPGTQNLGMIDLLRRSAIPFTTTATETGAAFMAIGYQRASGRLPLVLTIPGPGALYAIPGIAEARDDSVPLVWIVAAHPDRSKRFGLQGVSIEGAAAPVVKKIFTPALAAEIPAAIDVAVRTARSGEPGPVLVLIDDRKLDELITAPIALAPAENDPPQEAIEKLRKRLSTSARPLFFLGLGAEGERRALIELAGRCGAAVTTTLSGRGAIAEDDGRSIYHDFSSGTGPGIQRLFERADLVVACGVKFSHNGTGGFSLKILKDKLIHIDSSAGSLGGDYPASIGINADLSKVVPALADVKSSAGWDQAELDSIRAAIKKENSALTDTEPAVRSGIRTIPWRFFFNGFFGRRLNGWIVTTDSGLHQILIRRLLTVTEPRSFFVPADFQSMGYSIPAAGGAALYQQRTDRQERRSVAAVVGDGSLLFSLGELATIRRERLDLVVIVINDGGYGLIRRQQISRTGVSSGMDLAIPDLPALAASLGARYVRYSQAASITLEQLKQYSGLTIVEVETVEPHSISRTKLRAFSREVVRRLLGPNLIARVRRIVRK